MKEAPRSLHSPSPEGASGALGRPGAAGMLSIEVCYSLPDRQTLIAVELPGGATVRDALRASGIAAQHPEIDPEHAKTGIYGKLAPLDAVLADHDRVEIYRPLIVDPKVARQRRVDKSRREGSIEGRKWLPKDSR